MEIKLHAKDRRMVTILVGWDSWKGLVAWHLKVPSRRCHPGTVEVPAEAALLLTYRGVAGLIQREA